MTSTIESQIHPLFLNFKSKPLEHAYGAWEIKRLTQSYYIGLVSAAGFSAVIFGLQLLILGRFEWLPLWVNLVIAPMLSLIFTLAVRFTKVDNRAQLDLWGGIFLALGQIGQFWTALVLPELAGQYLFISVILSNMGNSTFTSINFRYLIPIVVTVLLLFLTKVIFLDQAEPAQRIFQGAMAVIFTSIGLASGNLIERSARTNFLRQNDLEQNQQELLSKNKELEQFAYIASHDLQEPLRSVTSFSQLINEEYRDQIGEAGGQYLDYLLEASMRMSNLVKGLLDYSRLGREAQLVTIDTSKCLSAVLVDLSTAIAESKAQVTTDPLPTIVGYETEFRQLLQNLLSNAIKFQQEGVPPRVHFSARKVGTDWEFSVRDNGIGIDPEYHERIFLIFQRLHNRSLYQGTGIGLANCRKIVELHRGTLRVESEKGKGSTFIFTIPIQLSKWPEN